MKQKKQNCWESKQCGRGPDVQQTDPQKTCPAATEKRLDGIHDGKNSGRACWAVAGTLCGGKTQGTHATKQKVCQKCDFYQQVAEQERDKLHSPLQLLSKLKDPSVRVDVSQKKFGVLIGGSGLIGGGSDVLF